MQQLETENAALKEQLSHQKTSIKAIDMVLGEFKSTYVSHVSAYDQHVHSVNGFRFGGVVPGKINGEDGVRSPEVTGRRKKALVDRHAESAIDQFGTGKIS